METSVTLLTPDMASTLLDNNLGNRRVRKVHVSSLAKSMENGQWKFSPQPIIIADSGRLLDGQHRLMAIVESGTSQMMTICTGACESLFDVLDIGEKRSYSDITGIPNKQAAVLSFLTFTTLSSNKNKRMSPQDIHPFHDIYGGIVEEVSNLCTASPKIFGNAACKAAAVYLIKAGRNAEYIKTQYKALCTKDFSKLSPVCQSFMRLVLRNIQSKSNMNKIDIFKYSLYAFDPNNSDSSRIRTTANGVAEFRKFSKSLLNNGK